MPLKTTSTGEQLFVLFKKSTEEVIKRDVRDSQRATVDLDPDLEYLPMFLMAQPDYDARYYSLMTVEGKDTNVTPAQYTIGWQPVKRAAAEILTAVEGVEASHNLGQYRIQERDKLMILGLGVLFRLTANQSLTTREQALKTRIIDVAAKIWKNDARRRDIETQVTAGQEPDLDAGWEPPATT